MNDPVYEHLREIAWRRKLTQAEEAELRAWLTAHPEAAAECELEFALNDALAKLPDAPVPSNFTARVLQEIQRNTPRRVPYVTRWIWIRNYLLPRAALAALVVGGGVFGFQKHRNHQKAEAVRESLVAIAAVPSLPDPDVLMDFDAIRKLDTDPVADQELLALLK